jgi:serine/threonine protein kinase/tetratricopeptide (TPR) repeat protein
MNERDIFIAALQKESAAERQAYLDEACATDAVLRQQVESLLKVCASAAGFLESPSSRPVATIGQAVTERPGTLIGPYKLMEQIGEGGMGLVFVAEQQHPVRRKVALKVIKPGMDTRQVVARFEAERQALALMDHPNIAKVHDGGETTSGRPYFVMELVKGVPITEHCDQNQVPVRERLELFLDVCQAVQHAHQKGIIHRDIKPSNVLIMSQDGTPLVKVIDFGVAKAVGQQLTDKTIYTQFAQLVGTPLYMSPEQAGQSGVDVDTRTDIYALGVLLYELLTGTTPFDRERLSKASYEEIRRIIREEEPPKPSTRISTLGKAATTLSTQRKTDPKRLSQLCRGELDWIVMKALEKDRNRRYETPSAFAGDVQRYLRDEPVQACPPSLGYRVRKFARRNKGPVLAASLLLLALVAGTIGTTLGLIEAGRQRDAAQEREAETRAILDFVENKILAAARPKEQEGGLGPKATLREAVEAALPFVQTSFRDQPLIEGRLRMTLGMSFGYLGDWDKAAEQFQKAHTLRSEHLGHDHPDTLASTNQLAKCYLYLGRYADALPLHEETLALRKVKLGPDHPDTLMSMNNVAESYRALGRSADALKLHEETLALRKATLGPDHLHTLMSLHNVGVSYSALGQHSDAAKSHEEALAVAKATLSPDHPDTLRVMMCLGIDYENLGRYADALRVQEETLALRKAKLGPVHPDTLLSMHNVAVCYRDLDRYAEALKLDEETLALCKTKLGPDHPDTLNSMVNVALDYAHLSRYTDALKLHEEALRLRTAKLGPNHPATADSLYYIGCVYALKIRKSKGGANEADLAMQWLKKAMAAGFEDAARIKTDTDLDALRGRADFKQLLAGLEAAKEKKK